MHIRRLPCLALAIVSLGIASPVPGAARSANPDPVSYSPTLIALLNDQGVTSLTLRVNPAGDSIPTPSMALHVVLKSFTDDGKGNFWNKTYTDIALNAQGEATFEFSDLKRYQLLSANVTMQSAQGTNSEVYRVDGTVLARPDLEVLSAGAPAQVMIHQPFNVQVSLHERLGDVGATCQVALLASDGSVLDQANAVGVGAGGTSGVVFTTRFDALGTYVLTVRILSSNPVEFDAANDQNNLKNVTVQVVGTISAGYSLSYGDYNRIQDTTEIRKYNFARNHLFSSSESSVTGKQEAFTYSSQFNHAVIFPTAFAIDIKVDGVSKLSGVVTPPAPFFSSFFDDGAGNTYSFVTYYVPLDAAHQIYFVSQKGTGTYGGSDYSTVYLEHGAVDLLFHSVTWFDYYTEPQISNTPVISGAFWHGRSRIDTDLRVVAGDGTGYGGKAGADIGYQLVHHGPRVIEVENADFNLYHITTTESMIEGWTAIGSGVTQD